MQNSFLVLGFCLLLCSFIKQGFGFQCYVTRDMSDPETDGEPFDESKVSKQDCPYTLCGKAIDGGEVRRGCTINPGLEQGCQELGGGTACICDSELCNGTAVLMPSSLFTLVALIVFKTFLR